MAKDKGIDMLAAGRLTRRIIAFALPLMASGIVQQSFNSVDVAVVGRFVGSHALAAVGANGPIIGLIINLFIGIAIGVNVVIANYIGQRNPSGVQKAVATSAALSLVAGALLLVLGLSIARPMLELLSTPENIIDDAALYLRIFSCGLPAMMIYNFGSAILRSIGDTRRPFYWLVAGGVVNVGLNLFFVLGLGWGVEGVATATAISNLVSAGGVVYVLVHDQSPVQLDLRKVRIHGAQCSKILQIGVPAGVQGMVFALSNVFIQSAINGYGSAAIAGSAAAVNYELYCYFVMTSFVQAAVAFMSQNYGAGQYRQCRTIYRRCMILGIGSGLILNLLIYFFHAPCVAIFTDDPAAAAFAADRIRTVLCWQWIAAIYEVSGAALRALGYSLTPTVITVFGTCVVRVGWVWTAHFSSFARLLDVYPITWIITAIAVFCAWLYIARRRLHRPDVAPQSV